MDVKIIQISDINKNQTKDINKKSFAVPTANMTAVQKYTATISSTTVANANSTIVLFMDSLFLQ